MIGYERGWTYARPFQGTLAFVDVLNESSVVFVADLAKYWDEFEGPGWEAISPDGEIKAFETEHDAQVWRGAECRRSYTTRLKLRLNASYGKYGRAIDESAQRAAAAWPASIWPGSVDVNSPYPTGWRGEA